MHRAHTLSSFAAGIAIVFAGAAHAGGNHPSAHGNGIAVQPGITKYFVVEAEQKSAATLAAVGHVSLAQDDDTGIYGDFALKGKVACLRVAGTHAVVGVIIEKGDGTAAGHEGEAFYVFLDDNEALRVPGTFGNSGYYPGTRTADCTLDGGTFEVVIKGHIDVDD